MKKNLNKLSLKVSMATTFVSFAFSTMMPSVSLAQVSYEVMCRNKAKELAALAYSNCMTSERQNQIDQIRSEYKDQLIKLKSSYGEKLKSLSDTENSQSETPAREMKPDDTSKNTITPENTEQQPQPVIDNTQENKSDEFATIPAAETTETVNTDASAAQESVAPTEYTSEAAVMNEPSQGDSMDVKLMPTTTSDKTLTATKTSKSKLTQSTAKAKKSTVAKTKKATTHKTAKTLKTASTSKKAHTLPEKKIKTQSIDLNSPSEVAGTTGTNQ